MNPRALHPVGWIASFDPERWPYYGAEVYPTAGDAQRRGPDELELRADALEEDVGDPRYFWVGRLNVAHHEGGGLWVVDRVERVRWPAPWRSQIPESA